jgi:hypothetical protein
VGGKISITVKKQLKNKKSQIIPSVCKFSKFGSFSLVDDRLSATLEAKGKKIII